MVKKNGPIANPMIVLREEFDDWAILFDPDTGNAFGLNPVSVLIWKLLDSHHSIEEIIKTVCETFNKVSEDVNHHVKGFIQDLLDRGLAGYEFS